MRHKKILLKLISLCVVMAVLLNSFLLINVCYKAEDYIEAKKILFINENSSSYITYDNEIAGIKEAFKDYWIKIDEAFMYSKRLSSEEDIENFYLNLKNKMEKFDTFDVIIVSGDNGLNFVLDYQETLFPQIPIVFMSIEDIELAVRANENEYITGIIEEPTIRETIEVATIVNSSADNVVAITDGSIAGKGLKELYYEVKDQFPNHRFKDLDLSEISYNDLETELQKLTKKDILIFLSATGDVNNLHESYEFTLKLIEDNCSQPIYSPYDYGIGKGVLGGKVVSQYEQGLQAGKVAELVIEGKDISQIAYESDSPNKYIFDYEMMTKYGVKEKLLPEESIIINKKVSVLEEYFIYIVGAFLLLLLQTIFIILLYRNIIQRKLTEEKLIESRESLLKTNEELSASLEEIKAQDEQINDLIYKDTLTGLNNRFGILQIIEEAISNKDVNKKLALIFLDMDNFKDINDTHGHDVGDLVLQNVGMRLKSIEGNMITAGRFGGDEFLILLEDKENYEYVVDMILNLQDLLSQQMDIKRNTFSLTFSMGVAFLKNNDLTRQELMKNADLALYKAKADGKNTYAFYEKSMKIAVEEKIVFERAIKRAFKNKDFFLNFQPYVDVVTHDVVGFEALIRWISDDMGYVPAYKLIRFAEDMGLIIELGDWVLREACKFAVKVNSGLNKKYTISVNVSTVQLMSHNYFERTMAIIEEAGVDPNWICLEMTETILIESLNRGIKLVEMLKAEGFGIAIDDFGTGYSSLNYFKDLPVTILKIDKSFVDNIAYSQYDLSLVNTMISIAHNRGVKVIAEGVEEESQLEVLKKENCDFIQGYLFSKPVIENDALELINKI